MLNIKKLKVKFCVFGIKKIGSIYGDYEFL